MSSGERDWPFIAVDLRRHAAGSIPPFVTESTELTLILRSGDEATVFRAAHGVKQSASAVAGTTFVIPVGTNEEATYLTGDIPEVMHLYLSNALFETIGREEHLPRFDHRDVRYVSGISDPSLAWLARRLGAELREETASGQALVETLGLGLAERMVLNYTSGIRTGAVVTRTNVGALDAARMRRVLDYVEANLDRTVTVGDMAKVACLSPFHFARAFRAASGRAPHRYLSEQRLRLAKRLLLLSADSLASIAATCCFSSQSNFTRAFSAAVGVSPAAFRRTGALHG